MPTRKEKTFRNFILCELSHGALIRRAQLSLEIQREIIQGLIHFGKILIDNETKRGDLVMLETPERLTWEGYVKVYGKKASKEQWNKLRKLELNMYYELAQYAKKKGRRSESLESGIYTLKSGLRPAMANVINIEEAERQARLTNIIFQRRNRFMQSRIQARKPKLVFVSSAHAIYLEHHMKPRNVLYTDPTKENPKVKKYELRLMGAIAKEYLKEKLVRRKRIAKEKGLRMKKRWRPKP